MPNIADPALSNTLEAATPAFSFTQSKDGSVKSGTFGGVDVNNRGDAVLCRYGGTEFTDIIPTADMRIWRLPVAFVIPGATTGVKTTLSLQNPFGIDLVVQDAFLDLVTVKASGQIDIGFANANNGAATTLFSNQSVGTAGIFIGTRGTSWKGTGNGSWLTFNVDVDSEAAAGTLILVCVARSSSVN
jgi:hypothetical protein